MCADWRASVVAELKDTFIVKGTHTLGPTVRIALPAIGNAGEFIFSGQMVHHAQLNDVELVVKRACHHRQACAGLLVQRPKSEVKSIQVVEQCLHRSREKFASSVVAGTEKIVVDTPSRPDEPIQNMSGRRDDVFLEPEVAMLVGEATPPSATRVWKLAIAPSAALLYLSSPDSW